MSITTRVPRASDAAIWAAQDRDREVLAAAFPTSRSPFVFLARTALLRRAARQGLAHPGLIVASGGGRRRVLGEMGVDAVDERTGTGELAGWTGHDIPGPGVAQWALAAVLSHAFRGPRPLRRALVPIAAANPANLAGRDVLRGLGFVREATLAAHRDYAGQPADHEIWVLQNSAATRDALRANSARDVDRAGR